MRADKAARTFALSGATYDFYDLDPFSGASPSPSALRDVTPGTDRRCEISFAGDYADQAAEAAINALAKEGINTPAALPATFTTDNTGTTLLAARRLNPKRVAIVHVGTRAGVQGTETFMLVERLLPSPITN
ncbi:MAG: succinyl-CoA synthetase subunit beta [Sulfitobacter sp.]